jgi:hypothetical protein
VTSGDQRNGVGWAYVGVMLGGAVSVAANVAHSFVPPIGAPPGWRPMQGAVLSAVFWPVALFVAIEILSRTTWPEGIAWRMVRLGGLLPVAVVAAVVSYRHLSGLIRYYGEDGLTAAFGPLAVDGLMIVASAALLASPSSPPSTVVSPLAEQATLPAGPVQDVASTDDPATPPASGDATTEPAAPVKNGSRSPTPRSQLDEARTFVRAELAAGRNPSGAAVGRRFGRNNRWGQRIVREVTEFASGKTDGAEGSSRTRSHRTKLSPELTGTLAHEVSTDEADPPSEPPTPDSPESVPSRSTGSPAEVHTKAFQSDGPARVPAVAGGADSGRPA